MRRLRFGLEATLIGQNSPDLLVPYRSVLNDLSNSGVIPCRTSREALSLVAQLWPRDSVHLIVGTDAPKASIDASTAASPLPGTFPSHFDSGPETLDLLRGLVQLARPTLVVETGVANGTSTRAILEELSDLGRGKLISFDVDVRARNAGVNLCGAAEWEFHLLNSKQPMLSLRNCMRRLADPVDIWYHDSDHTYQWQRDEYSVAWRQLSRPGLLVSDDIDGNGAFADFVKDVQCPSWLVFDGRKCAGVALSL